MIALLAFLIASAATADIVMITHGPPDVSLPHETTGNKPARYGMGFPLQVSGTEAAIFCNLRAIGPGYSDYEDGTDLLVFDNLRALRTAKPFAVSRNQMLPDAATGEERLVVKFPMAGGFWPIGAKAADGSRHPGEGRGFGICQALSFEVDSKGFFTWTKPFVRYVEVVQLGYDGAQFRVVKRELVGPSPLPAAGPAGWQLVTQGLTNAIPEGNDLLLPVLAQRDGKYKSGVCRWQWRNEQWTAVSFVPIGLGSEPTLVRVADRSLLFATRPGSEELSTVVVWRSVDAGKTWQEVVRQADVRSSSPVSISRTACGLPFIVTNLRGRKRTRLCFWTIDGASLVGPRLIRDCTQEFGPRPKETFWVVDHPSSATVRLADGQWHGLLAYRVKAYRLPTRGRPEPDVPQTGCYVEEILSSGSAVPEWQF
ncbi:MAG: exo-alpha-sialidase [Lentisphaeria bacterium]|nr:exo-alpha-sialidase [Lentisphaeria bacterium]